ncbi:MAG: YlxR family protein [Ruminiclostridium sp.]|nr:YlxR family protein [Ruminiclostridium sp.]
MGKNVPLRKCLGCDEMLGKKGLLRIVRTKDGAISLDPTGKMSGRGAYICKDAECFEKARKRKSLERALKCAIPAEIYDSLKEQIPNE